MGLTSGVPAQAVAITPSGILTNALIKLVSILIIPLVLGGGYFLWKSGIERDALTKETQRQQGLALKKAQDDLKVMQASQAATAATLTNLAEGSAKIREESKRTWTRTQQQIAKIQEDPSKSEEQKQQETSRVYAMVLREQHCLANPTSCKPQTVSPTGTAMQGISNFFSGASSRFQSRFAKPSPTP